MAYNIESRVERLVQRLIDRADDGTIIWNAAMSDSGPYFMTCFCHYTVIVGKRGATYRLEVISPSDISLVDVSEMPPVTSIRGPVMTDNPNNPNGEVCGIVRDLYDIAYAKAYDKEGALNQLLKDLEDN